MKTLKQQQLNVYDDFINHLNKLSKTDVLVWIKAVMEIHYDETFDTYNMEVLELINTSISGENNVLEARSLAFKIHRDAKRLQNDKQFYLRALAHMLSTIHVKTHALKCCDYIIKMIQFKTKDNDAVVGERLRQIILLKDMNKDMDNL